MKKIIAFITLTCCLLSLAYILPVSAENLSSEDGRHYVDLSVPDGAPLDYKVLDTTLNSDFELGSPTYYTGEEHDPAKIVVGQGPDSEDDREVFLLGAPGANVATVLYRQINSDYHIHTGMDAVYFRQRFKYKNEDQFRWIAGLRGAATTGEGAQLMVSVDPNKKLKVGGFVSEKTVPEDTYVTLELFVNFTDLTMRAYIDREEYTNGVTNFEAPGEKYPTFLEMIMCFSMSSGGNPFELHIDDLIVSSMSYGEYELLDAEGNETESLTFPEASVKLHMPKAILSADSSVVDIDSFQINNHAVVDSVIWEDDGMSCTVKLSNLSEGQKYALSFREEEMDPFRMEFETKRKLMPANVKLTDENGTDITDSGLVAGKVKAELSVLNQTKEKLPVYVAAAVHNDEGHLIDLKFVKTEAAAGRETPLSLEADIPSDGKKYELKLYYFSDPLNATAFFPASNFSMAASEVNRS